MTPNIKSSLEKQARGEPLTRDDFAALLNDPQGRKQLATLALVRSLFEVPEEDQQTPPDGEVLLPLKDIRKSLNIILDQCPRITNLARAGNIDDAMQLLREFAPHFLDEVGLGEEYLEEFMSFAWRSIDIIKTHGIRPVLFNCVTEYLKPSDLKP